MFFAQIVQLFFQLEAFETGELAQADFQNVFGLHVAQTESRHQIGLGLVRLADHADYFVDMQENNHPPFKDVDALFHLRQTVRQTAGNGGNTVVQPFLQNGFQVFLRRALVVAHHHQIYRHIAFQAGLRHQRIDETFRLDAAGFGLEHQAHRMFAVRFVAHALD